MWFQEDKSTCTSSESTRPNSLVFPIENLYELEDRVFTEEWSIPYKKDESLAICLVAATKLAKEGIFMIN